MSANENVITDAKAALKASKAAEKASKIAEQAVIKAAEKATLKANKAAALAAEKAAAKANKVAAKANKMASGAGQSASGAAASPTTNTVIPGPVVAGPVVKANTCTVVESADTESESDSDTEEEVAAAAAVASARPITVSSPINENTQHFVLIDGSYFVFYRYFALNVWWKNAKSGDKPDISCNDDPDFIEKFKKTFELRVKEIDECLGLKSSIKLAAVDCKRADIWRNHLYPDYKLTRSKDDEFGVSKFFKLTYDEKLFEAAGVSAMLMYQHLEADDCIALTTMHIRENYPDAHIWIIANDHDYIQLHDDHVHLRNLKYQDLTQSKSSSGDAYQDLFCKIVGGDKSDNIRSIFKKCGLKTARKYYNNPELFEKALLEEPIAEDLYCLNRTLVDFNYIPSDLAEGFRKECLLLPE